ncbi:hypothetical protein [Prevotella sp. P6B4]|uniref:hypothetical protein n=1 Tax=Prevotella sp. P6B4 TaxID=1410614 RepID=UPI0012DDF214|nr:hypothetical protein [Prevotella sp. P6B4]
MMYQIFKHVVATVVFVFASVTNLFAQQPGSDDMLNQIGMLKRLEAMQPDSVGPKYQLALASLNYAITNPQAPQTEQVLAQAEQTIGQLAQMKGADQSDLCTLRGFLLMVRIVQDPAQNGRKYYLDVMQNYEKALKLNPHNQLAQELQAKFVEGMKQATAQ